MPKTKREQEMPIISIHINKPLLDALDELVMRGVFPSRSEAIRFAIRDAIARARGDPVYELLREGERSLGQ